MPNKDTNENQTSKMLLKGKNVIIYGAAGGVGKIFSTVFAREGANMFLAGRTVSSLENVAKEIVKAGGTVDVDKVDALSPQSVKEHLSKVIAKTGRLDISLNLISASVGMGRSLLELSEEQFMSCAFTVTKSIFLTATVAAQQMGKQGSGVILGLTAPVARIPRPKLGGFAIGEAAIEAFYKQLALEIGTKNVRVVILRTGSNPDNPVFDEVFDILAKVQGTTKEAVEKYEVERTAFKRLPLLQEVANTAVLLASDYASTITATAINASNGDIVE